MKNTTITLLALILFCLFGGEAQAQRGSRSYYYGYYYYWYNTGTSSYVSYPLPTTHYVYYPTVTYVDIDPVWFIAPRPIAPKIEPFGYQIDNLSWSSGSRFSYSGYSYTLETGPSYDPPGGRSTSAWVVKSYYGRDGKFRYQVGEDRIFVRE